MTAGPFRPIRLEVSYAYIDHVPADYELVHGLENATGTVAIDVEGAADWILLVLRDKDNEVYSKCVKVASNGSTTLEFEISMSMGF